MLDTLQALLDPLNPSHVEAVYNRFGFAYNAMMAGNGHLAEAFATLHAGGGHRFLDVGAGAGRHLPHYLPEKTYHVIDLSPTGLFLNRMEYQRMKEPRPTVTFEEADAQRWREKGEPFDGAIFAYSLSTMKHPADAVRNVVEAVMPGGMIVILDYIETHEPLMPAWLARRLLAYDPARTIEELVGEAPLTLAHSRRFPSLLPEASLYVFTK